ncbi:hypothetical protein [Paeniclostridium hominis]|uniref:hypothetical protein n=1 Tax=Paeniclostridium hominis TaxID=2764329 RepID=UPI0022E4D3B9|nr:hypothetical protein [Paeniclostridium hominis]
MARSIIRKPSFKKSILARTSGRATRAIKKAFIPGYGTKGRGIITNPSKAAYNKVYRATSWTIFDVLKFMFTGKMKD